MENDVRKDQVIVIMSPFASRIPPGERHMILILERRHVTNLTKSRKKVAAVKLPDGMSDFS